MYVTLNITATSIRLLSVKGKQVEKWGSAPLTPGLVKDGFILQPKAVGAIIDALFKSTKVPKQKVITTLTGLSFTYRILSLPKTKSSLMEEAVQRSARKEIPLPLEELYLSWQPINGKQEELDYFVLGVPRNPIDAVVQALAEAGIEPYIVELKPLALARAANRGDVLIVDLEPDCFDVVLVAKGVPTVIHTITPRGEGANLEDNIRRLSDELSRTVKFYNTSHPQTPLSPTTPLLLTGELATNVATSRLIQAETGYPVKSLVPPLEFPSALSPALYATNMGLALKEAPPKAVKGVANGFHDINLNILADKYKAKAHPASKRRIILPLAIAVALGLLFGLYQLKAQADAETASLQTAYGAVSQQLHEARLALNETNETVDTINAIVADTAALKQEHDYILDKRGELAADLTLATGAFPPETYFTSIKMEGGQITVEGETNSASKVILYAETLEEELGFSEVRISNITELETTGITQIAFAVVITKGG
jgi:type IV pilus assembly protein PilM